MTTSVFDETNKFLGIQHIVFVVDKSSSMEKFRDVTISGYNESVDAIKQACKPKQRVRFSRVDFNHGVDVCFVNKGPSNLWAMNHHNYHPNGMTAMLDAIGAAIDHLAPQVTPQDAVLVKVFSDGEENSSKKYTYAKLGAKIQELEQNGQWTFEYIGSNQNLARVADQLNIPRGNVANYTYTTTGTASAYGASTSATMDWMGAQYDSTTRGAGPITVNTLYSSSNTVSQIDEEGNVTEDNSE